MALDHEYPIFPSTVIGPSYPLEVSVDARNIKSDFSDGMMQIRPDGFNNLLSKIDMSWDVVTESEKVQIETFLKEMQGYKSFYVPIKPQINFDPQMIEAHFEDVWWRSVFRFEPYTNLIVEDEYFYKYRITKKPDSETSILLGPRNNYLYPGSTDRFTGFEVKPGEELIVRAYLRTPTAANGNITVFCLSEFYSSNNTVPSSGVWYPVELTDGRYKIFTENCFKTSINSSQLTTSYKPYIFNLKVDGYYRIMNAYVGIAFLNHSSGDIHVGAFDVYRKSDLRLVKCQKWSIRHEGPNYYKVTASMEEVTI